MVNGVSVNSKKKVGVFGRMDIREGRMYYRGPLMSPGCGLYPKIVLPITRGFLSSGATDAARRHLTQRTQSCTVRPALLDRTK
jgi:hypothetical protein